MNRSSKLPHSQNSRGRLLERKPRQQRHVAAVKQSAKQSATSRSPKSAVMAVNHLPQPQVRQLHHPDPTWLKSLFALQRISLIIFGSIFGLSSLVYGYTMHTQSTWRSQQDQLRRWQNQERHQGVMTEKLNQQIAKTAEEKDSGLVNPKPNLSVFVNSATPRPPKPLPIKSPAPISTQISKIPLGY
jgi:hypothetical protein